MTTKLNQEEDDFEIVNESDVGLRQAETIFLFILFFTRIASPSSSRKPFV